MDGVKSLSKFAIPEDIALLKDWSVDVNFCNVKSMSMVSPLVFNNCPSSSLLLCLTNSNSLQSGEVAHTFNPQIVTCSSERIPYFSPLQELVRGGSKPHFRPKSFEIGVRDQFQWMLIRNYRNVSIMILISMHAGISISSIYVQFDLTKKWISLLDSDSYSSRVSSVCPRNHTMFTLVICCTLLVLMISKISKIQESLS